MMSVILIYLLFNTSTYWLKTLVEYKYEIKEFENEYKLWQIAYHKSKQRVINRLWKAHEWAQFKQDVYNKMEGNDEEKAIIR